MADEHRDAASEPLVLPDECRDDDIFEQWLTTHYRRMRRIVTGVARFHAPDHLVEDVWHETVMALHNTVVVRGVPVRNVEHWLRVTGVRRATSVWRKWVREERGADADIRDYIADLDPHEPLTGERVAHLDLLNRALATMTWAERTCLVLHHLAGWKVSEIAAYFGNKPSTVKTQLSRARAKGRRSLTEGET